MTSRHPNIVLDIKKTSIDTESIESETLKERKRTRASGLRVGSLLRTWAEVSKINYLSMQPLDILASEIFIPININSTFDFQFPINVTQLMNEDQLWGCFYTFPELYADVYSPVVHVHSDDEEPEIVGGVLTREAIAPRLTYLKRIPILGDFVYIKLDLSSKHLVNIEVLEHYKYLVYLDLSSNYLVELNVLSHLPYLQYLSVSFNRLSTVLEYDAPQWFLTEVHYKFNSVKKINDLSAFWSITILDLSHNNIKSISGLQNLRCLRRLDLSFNHIQRLENLNNLNLLWLDVSYNNISSFELGPRSGLWTLLHLEYLNLNENSLSSMKMFTACSRLRELHVRNNRLSMLLELAVYMRQLRRLIVLDLRANPVCSSPGYKDVTVNTFPALMSLDAEELDPIEQRTLKMEMTPDVTTFALRRLLRLLYIEQLSRARVSPFVPFADTTDVSIVVLVGYEAVGKGSFMRRLSKEFPSNIEIGKQHTTALNHHSVNFIEISRDKFDDMLLAGEFLTYGERDGDSYGLSREEAFVKDGKVKIVAMDLLGALMLKLRGLRPYLILASYRDKATLAKRQLERKASRDAAQQDRASMMNHLERSTLQVLLSGRIIITGILNEIIMCLPEGKEHSEFIIESECSLMMDSEVRKAVRNYANGINTFTLMSCSGTSSEESCKPAQEKPSQINESLYSLYKESQGTDEYFSFENEHSSYQERSQIKKTEIKPTKSKNDKQPSIYRPKSVDFSRYASSTWKGLSVVPDGSKSSKSVTFISQDNNNGQNKNYVDPSGMLIEPQTEKEANTKNIRSISTRLPWPARALPRLGSGGSLDDQDLWLAFLTETGLMQSSDARNISYTETVQRNDTKIDNPDSIIHQMDFYEKIPSESFTTNIRDDYDEIHRKCPGLFWDTIVVDDNEEAFQKLKSIIRNIVNSQKNQQPMFDIDFTNLKYYPTVKKRLIKIQNEIGAQKLFN
ncbi:uncharacterized protein LOC114251455 [Bombyx mandarina]|uniref:Uncharacterized protein LOC114251455 n=1 Tax=Bombyx mandarina TaxID=7092 RepID=A0A6J2KHM4_BOMMA|nr:uncharacterized protein LOC114251455 [Bombyx mandarina]